jgi:EAL domain-containing protein (putative c-di-GMP-specific phosphodiesterase class I)
VPPREEAPGSYPERVLEHFCGAGGLGILFVSAPPLESIERLYGPEASRRAALDLCGLVREAACARLRSDDLVLTGVNAAAEIVGFVLRPRNDRVFFRDGLPALAEALADALAQRARAIFYPYRRQLAQLPVGQAFAIHNPALRPETPIHRAVARARREAEFRTQVAEHDRQRRFMQLLLDEDLSSVYQPVLELETQSVFGYEALIRGAPDSEWQSPNLLFQQAAEADLTFEFDCLCRRIALESPPRLPEGGKLFVNVLPTAIHDPSFQDRDLRRTLERSGLRPQDVVFEISEKECIDNFAIFREARDHYASLGFRIALDDTGAGYSSLRSAMELCPDFIKVDMELVRSIDVDPPRQELLRALARMGDKIGSRLIAEGIETAEELEALLELGIPLGQGYLFGAAVPARSVRAAR